MTARRLITNAVLAELRLEPFPVGDARAPDTIDYPYAVLYPLDINEYDGDLRSTQVTGWHEYQVTSVAETREQAEGMADLMRARILGNGATATGYVLGPWESLTTGVIDRDDDADGAPSVFYAIDQYRVFVAPA